VDAVDQTLAVLRQVADAVAERLLTVTDWGLSGVRDTQYVADVHADEVAVSMLVAAGFGVLSEESGLTATDRSRIVVVDPIDGSTNASRRIPWYATALCVVDDAGPAVALVVNQATGTRFEAVRGGGAWAMPGDRSLAPSGRRALAGAVVGVSGRPEGDWGWWQYRSLGAGALDVALVASGSLDGFVDLGDDAHGVWDYLASTLICAEAGAPTADALGRDLVVLDPLARRTPVAAATPELLEALLERRAATTGANGAHPSEN
jgi:fructose-1,6-bisphosphatase/inositol monophosphatase family enzyme